MGFHETGHDFGSFIINLFVIDFVLFTFNEETQPEVFYYCSWEKIRRPFQNLIFVIYYVCMCACLSTHIRMCLKLFRDYKIHHICFTLHMLLDKSLHRWFLKNECSTKNVDPFRIPIVMGRG